MKKTVLAILIAVILTMANTVSNAASSSLIDGRQTFNADFNWKFLKGDVAGAEKPTFDDKSWRTLDLPHDWSIEGPFSETAAIGPNGGYLPTGIGWYRRHINPPKSWEHKKVLIEFDGVYEHSSVWVNGNLVGYRPFGYIGFQYDLTPFLKFGHDNIVSVKVDNSQQINSRWYSGSGIYRNVWLTVISPVHIAHWGTCITTPTASSSSAAIHVVTTLQNDLSHPKMITLSSDVVDQSGAIVATLSTALTIAPGSKQDITQDFKVANPVLWNLETPNLYHLHSSLKDGDTVLDHTDTPFGIRTISYDVDKGFFLNGVHIKMHGMCLHEDAGAVGSAILIGVWKRRLELLKSMGCNAIRCSHNPPDPGFLDLCDQLGFLVMDESFDEWTVMKPGLQFGYSTVFKEWSQRDLSDMLVRDRNHPSIVLWNVGNEIGDQTIDHGVDIVTPLVQTCHKLDPTRPVTAACDNVYTGWGHAKLDFLAALDIVGYNYVDRWGDRRSQYYADDRRDFPTRKFIGTEESPVQSQRGVYAFAPSGSDHLSKAAWTLASINTESLLKFDQLNDYVIGEFFWTGIDYLGEAHAWPRKSASAGAMDTCGFKKDSYYFYQSRWTTSPMLHILPHWNWSGHEGDVIPVVCYTNCTSVELFVNGKSFGVKSLQFPVQGFSTDWGKWDVPPAGATTSDLHLTWDVPYQPGIIEAVGYRGGVKVADEQIKTAGAPAKVVLSVDKTSMSATGQDVAHITATVVDSNGVMVPDASNNIKFGIKGAGHFIGLDNGDPTSHEDYKSSERHVYNGLCLAIVESNRQPGNITVTASSDGLAGSTVEISSTKSSETIAVLP